MLFYVFDITQHTNILDLFFPLKEWGFREIKVKIYLDEMLKDWLEILELPVVERVDALGALDRRRVTDTVFVQFFMVKVIHSSGFQLIKKEKKRKKVKS